MSKYEALRICPELIIVVGDNKKYTYTSSKIMELLQDYSPVCEVYSIDEAWLDVTHSLSIFGSAENIAYKLKARIYHNFGLRCSIGIAPNKMLAKVAADIIKPDGMVIIKPEEVKQFMEHLPIQDLCGIGKNMQKKLNMMSIYRCGELGRCDEARLTSKFGIIGKRLKEMGQGIDNSPVVPYSEDTDTVKSVGHSRTLERDISDPVEIKRFLLQLSEMVGSRARRYDVAGKTISLYVRYSDFFTSWGKQTTLEHLLYPPVVVSEAVRAMPEWSLLQKEMSKKNVTLALLWDERV
jgi:DNA polymerase-4